MFHVVLVEPEIPPNTGNVILLCANTGAQLHLIEPLGFPLWELPIPTATQSEVLEIVRRLADERRANAAARDSGAKGETAIEYISDFAPCAAERSPNAPVAISPLSSAEIATAFGKDRRGVRRHLCALREKGYVRTIGQRGGWWPVDELTPPPAPPV